MSSKRKKSAYEQVLDTEIAKREGRLNKLLNERITLQTELDTLLKSKELFIQSKKRQKLNGENK